ncbi:hypothetical protein [Prochlorococcus marinus]|nr:hypothetical protein [Prochlorococcus marinus]
MSNHLIVLNQILLVKKALINNKSSDVAVYARLIISLAGFAADSSNNNRV